MQRSHIHLWMARILRFKRHCLILFNDAPFSTSAEFRIPLPYVSPLRNCVNPLNWNIGSCFTLGDRLSVCYPRAGILVASSQFCLYISNGKKGTTLSLTRWKRFNLDVYATPPWRFSSPSSSSPCTLSSQFQETVHPRAPHCHSHIAESASRASQTSIEFFELPTNAPQRL